MKRSDDMDDLGNFEASELDLFLDGLLGDEERAAFELRMARDERLALEIDRQDRVDGFLLGNYAAPSEHELAQLARRVTHPRRSRAWLAPLAAAGVLVAASLIATFAGLFGEPNDGPASDLGARLVGLYGERYPDAAGAMETAEGAGTCGDHATWLRDVFATPASCVSPGHEIQLVDTASLATPPLAACARVLVGGESVLLVVADPTAAVPAMPLAPSGANLRLYRGQLQGHALYEISPLERPWVLETLGALDNRIGPDPAIR